MDPHCVFATLPLPGPPSATPGCHTESLEPTPSCVALWNSRSTGGGPSAPRFGRIPSRPLSRFIATSLGIGELPPLPRRRIVKFRTPQNPQQGQPCPFPSGGDDPAEILGSVPPIRRGHGGGDKALALALAFQRPAEWALRQEPEAESTWTTGWGLQSQEPLPWSTA